MAQTTEPHLGRIPITATTVGLAILVIGGFGAWGATANEVRSLNAKIDHLATAESVQTIGARVAKLESAQDIRSSRDLDIATALATIQQDLKDLRADLARRTGR